MFINCNDKELDILKKIALAAEELGISCYLIGGFVRDKILSRDTKDMDIVCVGDGIELAAKVAEKLGLGINAGHDLSLENLKFFKENIPGLMEVSIGHALISDALYFGLENTVQMYLRQLSS